ncbi:MAG: ferrochelatase [Bryobacteraceae bacterium]|nr:ferrochelatase [Bryobacteraceae bacterium]
MQQYDALLVLSFGGPEQPDDVMPFLENVTRGRNVPRERLEEVAENYYSLGGRSPINEQCRELIAAVEIEFAAHGIHLPIYWGNRNWHPFLEDTVRQMTADGVRRALLFVTSAYSSYSGCRQYREDVERAREAAGPGAPEFEKLRHFFEHPGFREPMAEHLCEVLARIPPDRREAARLLFTAHSIPVAMARTSRYEEQLHETAASVAAAAGRDSWDLVWQSRSGPPQQPWLEPDICDALTEVAAGGVKDVVVQPIGFISDHMEVIVDLDMQARSRAESLGMNMVRAATVGAHPKFVAMVRELVQERLDGIRIGTRCLPEGCCPSPQMLRAGGKPGA